MKEATIIKKLLNLGFKDQTYSIDRPCFNLDINGFSLQYEKGKFTLEGNGGYDESGSLNLDHFKIKDIKPLYKLLTGTELKESKAPFNFNQWKEKIKKESEERQKRWHKSDLTLINLYISKPVNQLGFLDFITKNPNSQNDTVVKWSENKTE